MNGNNIYASARAKALEPKLVSKDKINRLIDCSSAAEAVRMLSEFGFGGGKSLTSPLEFETLIDAEMERFSEFVREVSPDENFTRYFLLESDYVNAQAYMRSKYLQTDVSGMLVADGIYKKPYLKDKIMADDYSPFTKNLAYALLAADNMFVDKKACGSELDNVFKTCLALDKKECAKNSQLKAIFENYADTANISSALRLKNYKEFAKIKIDGGTIPDKVYEKLSGDSLDSIADSVFREKYYSDILKGIDDANNNKPLFLLEKAADDFPVAYFKKDLYDTNSSRPFLLYCFYTLNEIKNVRIVLVGLINGSDKKAILERVREGYDG